MPTNIITNVGDEVADETAQALRVLMVDASGNPLLTAGATPARLAADNLALPTAPDVLATLLAYDGTNLDLLRTLVPGVDPTTGILLSAQIIDQNGTPRRVTAAASAGDAGSGQNAPTSGSLDFNNVTGWDRRRNNTEGTLLASAARTATTSSADQINYNGCAGYVYLNITVVPTVETLTLTIEAKAPVSGNYVTLFTSALLATTGQRAYAIMPAGPAAADGITGVCIWMLPRTWRVTITHSASGSFTYSVGYALSS